MILMTNEALSVEGGDITISTDINMSPSDVAVTTSLSGFSYITSSHCGAYSGISGFTTQDPNTGESTDVDTSQNHFHATPVLFGNNVITITFVTVAVTGQAVPYIGQSVIYVSAVCQVNFN